MSIAIVDAGLGNLRSVANAVAALGAAPAIVRSPHDLAAADAIILPGVGAFGDGMRRLRAGGWVPALEQAVLGEGKPFLGICLGMQLLASRGTEHGDHAGLGWLDGTVTRLPGGDPAVRVPHVGWNDVEIAGDGGMYAGCGPAPDFYFVHSYRFEPADPAVVTGWCTHGVRFAASVARGNIRAVQFHPEKSQGAGMAVLRNFLPAVPATPAAPVILEVTMC
ncbi:imidazole glycerol phosphate synthase subunit HisH [bacterium]|nr:imidazole glycerol phosphate synthase subunit HisH [bacterium]